MAVAPKDNELHRIAVTGIIWKEESGVRKYLVTKRAPSKKAWPNKWTVPGGTEPSYQNDESPQWYGATEQTLRREIREEVNLEVSDIEYLLDLAFVRPDGIPVIVLSFYCKYASGEVKLDADATEYAWIAAAEVSKYDLIQGIDHEIELVEQKLAKQQ
jgi:8-oxo-dGTP pyrophosphatase MutT (NUDIX family)